MRGELVMVSAIMTKEISTATAKGGEVRSEEVCKFVLKKMTASSNGNGTLVDEFEEAFQSCLNVLTKEGALPSMDKDEINVDVDHTILKFIDLARQLEAFFLQKRFLLSALKPESVVKEDINDLRAELNRKDELIKRHYDKISAWQTLLADLQVQSWAKSPAQGSGGTPMNGTLTNAPTSSPSIPQTQPGLTPSMQQQIQQQHMHQQQMQQMQQQQIQHHMQQQMGPGGTGAAMVSQQAMFIPQAGGPRFPVQGPGGMLQGPLAYLEKTTSNIGMPDGRR